MPADPNPKYLKDPYWNVVGRLRDGVTQQRGLQELAAITATEGNEEKQFEWFTPQLEPLTDEMNRKRIATKSLCRCARSRLITSNCWDWRSSMGGNFDRMTISLLGASKARRKGRFSGGPLRCE